VVAVIAGVSLPNAGAAALGDEPTGLIAPAEDCPGQYDLEAPDGVQSQAMLCLMNHARTASGLPSLIDAGELDWSADTKARDILRCGSFSHYACGRDFTHWISESGYLASRCWRAGENLGWGVGEQATARSIFISLMHSTPHRRNILGRFDRIGIGLRVGRLGSLEGAHVWVLHFGTHCEMRRTRGKLARFQ